MFKIRIFSLCCFLASAVFTNAQTKQLVYLPQEHRVEKLLNVPLFTKDLSLPGFDTIYVEDVEALRDLNLQNSSFFTFKQQFLNEEFHTKEFSRAVKLGFCAIKAFGKNEETIIAAYKFTFPVTYNIEVLKTKLSSLKRNYFAIKALTYFTWFVLNRDLYLLETSYGSDLQKNGLKNIQEIKRYCLQLASDNIW